MFSIINALVYSYLLQSLRYTEEKNIHKLSCLFSTILHASVCSVLCMIYLGSNTYSLVPVIKNWSIGYFLYDTQFYIEKFKPIYLLHHFTSIAVIALYFPKNNKDMDGIMLIYGTMVSEMGNFTVYNVNLKMYKNDLVTIFDLILEMFAFLVWRNINGIILMYNITNVYYKLIVCGFWLVSLWWGYGISKQIYKRLYKQNRVFLTN